MFSYNWYLRLSSGPAPSLVAQGRFQPNASFNALAAFSSSAVDDAATIVVSIPSRAAIAPVVLTAPGRACAHGVAAILPTVACGASSEGKTTPDI